MPFSIVFADRERLPWCGNPIPNRGAQTAFILFSTFLDLRPVSAANDLQTSINGRLEIGISNSKTPVLAALMHFR
jgi:hypothetical protein